jgi:hypothetical protein
MKKARENKKYDTNKKIYLLKGKQNFIINK